MLVSMLQGLSQRYGQPCDVITAGPWTEPILRRADCVQDVRILTSRRTPYLLNSSQRELVAWLRARPAGPVYMWEWDKKSHRLLQHGAVDRRWICSVRDIAPRGERELQVDHQWRLACLTPAALGGKALPRWPEPIPDHRMRPTAADVAECEHWLGAAGLLGVPLVLLQPGNKRTMRWGRRRRTSNVKYWPERNWAEVIEGIRETMPQAHVLIVGVPAETKLATDILRACGDTRRVHDVTNATPIPRLFALLARAHSMVSVDTGPAHLASAIGCPLVVLFAHRCKWRYSVRATTGPVLMIDPPASTRDGVEHETAMAQITADRVLAAWRSIAV